MPKPMLSKALQRGLLLHYIEGAQSQLPASYKPNRFDKIMPWLIMGLGFGLPVLLMRSLVIELGYVMAGGR